MPIISLFSGSIHRFWRKFRIYFMSWSIWREIQFRRIRPVQCMDWAGLSIRALSRAHMTNLGRIWLLETAKNSNFDFGAKISKLNFGAKNQDLRWAYGLLMYASRQNSNEGLSQPRPQVRTDSTSSPGCRGWTVCPEIDFAVINLWLARLVHAYSCWYMNWLWSVKKLNQIYSQLAVWARLI